MIYIKDEIAKKLNLNNLSKDSFDKLKDKKEFIEKNINLLNKNNFLETWDWYEGYVNLIQLEKDKVNYIYINNDITEISLKKLNNKHSVYTERKFKDSNKWYIKLNNITFKYYNESFVNNLYNKFIKSICSGLKEKANEFILKELNNKNLKTIDIKELEIGILQFDENDKEFEKMICKFNC